MTESKAREFWLLKDADGVKNADYLTHEPTRHTISDFIHVIEKSFADKLQAELADLKAREIAHLALIQDYRKGLKLKNELLRECEKALEMIATNIKRESKYLHWTSVDIAKEMLQKLREGKK